MPAPLPAVRVPDLPLPLTRLVLGTVRFSTDDAERYLGMLDRYVAGGGNVIDTARLYGTSELVIGQWLARRGNRDRIVLCTKGGHGPDHRLPDADMESVIETELSESLERLQTDRIDLYWLHRDNPVIPVERVIDCLNGHFDRGRILAFGGSNWSPERIDAANDYAQRNGLRGFSAVSNNMSLAEQPEPFYPGLLTTGPDEVAWHRNTGLPLFAWSSGARGFFTGVLQPEMRARIDAIDDAVTRRMLEVYCTDGNFERRRRAQQIADRDGTCSATAVAIAWLLYQPCAVLPIIGPLTVEELDDSLRAASLELTEQEVAWLDLKD